MVTTLLLTPPYTTENLTGVRVPMLNPRHCGDNQKVIALHLRPAIPLGGGGGGHGSWIQMTGALSIYYCHSLEKKTLGQTGFEPRSPA